MKRRVSILLILLATIFSSAQAAPPRLVPGQAVALEAAHQSLLTQLAAPPTKAALHQAEQALATIRRTVDAFFHAPNLRTARAEALALRPGVQRLRAGEQAVLVLVDDVLHVRPAIHSRLAEAYAALGQHREALGHRLAALAVEDSAAHREAALQAAEAAGDQKAVAGLRERQPLGGDQKP